MSKRKNAWKLKSSTSFILAICLALFLVLGNVGCEDVPIRLKTSNNLRGIPSTNRESNILVPAFEPSKEYLEKYFSYIEAFFNNVNSLSTLSVSLEVFSSICFVLCLRGLSTQETAKRGNFLGIVGITCAIAATFLAPTFAMNWIMFIVPFALAIVIGVPISHCVSMVNIPQLVALFHSFVGLAAMLISFANLWTPFNSSEVDFSATHAVDSFFEGLSTPLQSSEEDFSYAHAVEMFIGESISAITFTGSIVAAGKLHEIFPSGALKLPGRHFLNALMVAGLVALGSVFIVITDYANRTYLMYGNSLLSMLLGIHLVASIGGADMPVAISMLNSYSGWATSFTGFLINSKILIICGALIGSSGAILSHIMCIGMNRSLMNVMLGGWEGSGDSNEAQALGDQSDVNQTNAMKVARDLLSAKKVLIVPGYGMAVSRSQQDVASIVNALRLRDVHVEFAIHPVAGRMPGHMNVLLAEADVPYSIVKEMEDVNPHMESFDIVLVIGANDTVNPLALEKDSKINGMPVIEVWRASKVIVSKRSLGKGYAAIDNPLFFMRNVEMIFGNAKESMINILQNIMSISPEQKKNSLSDDQETIEGTTVRQEDKEEYPTPTMTIGVLKEDLPNEKLVAIAPNFVKKLRKLGFRVLVESGAGKKSKFDDQMYEDASCTIMATRQDVVSRSDVIVKVQKPTDEEVSQMKSGQTLVSYIWPAQNPSLLESLANKGVTTIALDEVPRTTRAQKLDIRSSMSNLAGYRAVIEAFVHLPKLSKSSITAAGRVDAARVFVIGAGVAGLQAIATAKNLGADVFASDTRTATREEVESLGAKFVTVDIKEEGDSGSGYAKVMSPEYLKAQSKLYSKMIKSCDVVITTALIPGKPSPKIITREMVNSMKSGSVIVDMAAEMADTASGWGGNCEITKKDQVYLDEKSGVTIIGLTNLPSTMPSQASELFSMNVVHMLEELGGAEHFSVDMEDSLLKEMVVTINEKVTYIPVDKRPPPPKSESSNSFTSSNSPSSETSSSSFSAIMKRMIYSNIFFGFLVLFSALISIGLGYVIDHNTLGNILVFSLSVIVGYYCIWNVTPSLHTPLMSVTNALSGIIIIGAMLQCGPVILFTDFQVYSFLLFLAMLLSSINIIGGFYVTTRMLYMFTDNQVGSCTGEEVQGTRHTSII
ncbi:pyridine nucleotide NAD(P) transhydrogenase alpha plus beta subunits [Cryptosporidium sp. chipmunk genotype I]|uniref:pyridine nucleotide NAD(P) transhydrogenase alpha plus beta subunits n=1 Tax=Cryptosporidium sp. chipmunk genotype I TaxID=1280935 RepID=UPI00351A17B9|nr:pyridine nucleotide NAD(P) transhydrogenase alpha plus beta subunits [Cryptosporidium sp. chipmunk genotype I]